MSEMMRQMNELEERIDKLVILEPQQKIISPSIENCYLPSTIQPECQNDNGMELEDNSRYQLMTKLMSQMIEFNNLVKKLIDQQELQLQTIKFEVVEPPSPSHSHPQNNSLTYWLKMHNNMAQSTPIDDGYSEESYDDETNDVNDIEGLGVEI